MPQEQTYTYYAFVSYSHKDETWGRWIQRALESYRLPAAVRKEVGKPLPQRIHPVFRDDTDLGAGRLADNLRQELEQSRYLIVVCSPNSAKPNDEGKHWVNEEVTRFCEMGRADSVIPVIVEGTAETSFCPKIVEEGLLGLDATKHTRTRILNDLVAKILGLRPDELWRREERRLRTKRRWRFFAASLVASLVALGGYIWWDCTRTVTRAFADYVDSYGLPEGIFPLTKEQVSHRHVHYRFEFQGYRCEWFGKSIHADSAAPSLLKALGFRRVLKSVHYSENPELFKRERINVTTLFQMQPPFGQSFRYTARGNLAEIMAHSASDREISIAFDRKKASTFIRFSNPTSGMPLETPVAIFGLPDVSGTGKGVFAWKARYDKRGRLVEILYVNSHGKTVNDSQSNSGLEFSTDKQGRVTETRLKGRADGVASEKYVKILFVRTENPKRLEFHACEENGEGETIQYALVAITYDNSGRPVAVRFPPRKSGIGTLHINSYSNASYEGAWDSQYVRLERRYDLTQYTTRESNPTGWDSQFDDQGNEVARRFVDVDGKPAMTDYGYAGWNSSFDGQGRETMRVCVGLDDKPVAVEAGPAGWTVHYGVTNVMFSYVDAELKPCFCRRKHFAFEETAYDSFGNEVFRVYRDVEGKPRIQPDGCAGWVSAYDENGNKTNTVFLGDTLLPADQPEGYAGYSTEFDAFGRKTSRRFFDSQGMPCASRDGYAGWDKRYDSTGQETNRIYISESGGLALVEKNGLDEKTGPVAGWWKQFSADGDLVAIGTLGTNNLPLVNRLGWASKRFDKNGELWFDEHGESIFHPHPSRIVEKTYGSSPFEKTTWWIDEETGVRIKGKDGAFGHRELFNDIGECTNMVYLGADGAPCMSKFGYAECRTEYKAQYKPIRTAYYDTDGNHVTNDQGYAVQIETWDEHGKDTSVQWYDPNGDLVERYPNEGVAYRLYEFYPPPWDYQESSMTYIGTNSLPVNNKKEGYARIEYDQTPDHKRIGSLYYLADGRPFYFRGGHSGFLKLRDHHYNITNFFYLGADGRPVLNMDKGMASYTMEYDYSLGTLESDRRITAQFFFDAEGHPISLKTGEAGWRDKFDDYGRQIERTYFGTNGLPVMTKYGFATRQMFYDETTGVETNRVMLDADGEVIQPKKKGEKKKYSWKPHYDEAGLLVEETYEAEDGTLGKDYPTRASSITYKYDNNGMETNRMYRGIHGEPILCDRWPMNKDSTPGRQWRGERGYFELRQVYDDQGRLAEKSFWNTNGTAIACSVGAHIMRYAYDAAGHLIETRFFGTDSQPCANREGVHVEQRILGEDGTWADTVRLAVDGTRLCKWTTEVVKSVTPGSFADQLGIRPGDRWVKWGDNIFSEADLSSMKPNMGRVDFERWQERMRQSSIDPNFVSILAKKDHDDFVILAFFSRILNSTTLGFENAWNRTSPTEQEGAALLSRTVGWLQTSSPKSIVLYDGAEKR